MESLLTSTDLSALGYESTQTRIPSKSTYFVRNVKKHLMETMEKWGWAWLCCNPELIPETDKIVAVTQIVVECDVADLAEEIAMVNVLLEEARLEAMEGLCVAERAAEVVSTRQESNDMLAEDRDVAEVRTPFVPVQPEILTEYLRFMAPMFAALPAIEEELNAAAGELFVAMGTRQFEDENELEQGEIQRITAVYSDVVRNLYQHVRQPDGTWSMLYQQPHYLTYEPARQGATAAVPGWSLEQQNALIRKERSTIVPRKVFPRLVAASTLDARSRWGLLPDTQANRLMVGHHMRKQLLVGKLRKSTVDQNVALALNLFFVPHAGDLIARAQAQHWQHGARWRAYDLQGSTWWQRLLYTGHAAATPVV